jgi:prophage regulatory protein
MTMKATDSDATLQPQRVAISPLEPLMTLADVEAYLGIKKSAIYQAIKEGRFPAPIQLTPNTRRWRRPDVVGWVNALAAGAR